MMTTTLINSISELDKKRIRNYIVKYGGISNSTWQKEMLNDNDLLEKWLSNWSANKQKLYRLLGESLVYSENVEIPNNEEFLWKRIKTLNEEITEEYRLEEVYDNFKRYYNRKNKEPGSYPCYFYLDYCVSPTFVLDIADKTGSLFDELTKEEVRKDNIISSMYNLYRDTLCVWKCIQNLFRTDQTVKGIVEDPIRVRETLSNGTFRILKINKGEKIGKARTKLLDFFGVFEEFPEYKVQHEKYEKICNEIRSRRSHPGVICLSIHPLDFITMSDNGNHWNSCMNWTEDREGGCYRVGTVEMMNSNMAVCAYVLSDDEKKRDWFFGEYGLEWEREDKLYPDIDQEKSSQKKIDEWTWNNKQWRCLYYINKDIVCSGKAYPYRNDALSLKILDMIKNLAEKNLNWTYQFGPQLYQDMKTMNFKNYDKYRGNELCKDRHKILFETKGMYNDFLNYPDYNGFYCYRNYVKKNKILCLSGEPLAIDSGRPYLSTSGQEFKYLDTYNNRYSYNCDLNCLASSESLIL